ncbi:AraC family transcriptional regulator [Mucilaginibacter glaciei]|uniref:Helix-turn-helix transcriptional regulator n=1 Tax=Mucilaginibacter glaciei TaxID=2772109 RepID=A0A926NLC8_9SPHI|nr:AraC family transcriptional regulator [Mucilaginibacter glaciei]MBD1394214.1 helix-turn-helix transcriptional regulator [Mucilaginibacter glaciei]
MNVLEFTIPVAHDQSVIVQEDAMPYFYPYLHRHNEAQLIWILEGEGTLIAGTDIHTFNSNDIFLLGANQPHLFKSNPDYFSAESNKQIRSVMVFFNPYGNLAPLFQLPEMVSLLAFIRQHSGGFKLPATYVTAVSQLILAIQTATDAERITRFIELLTNLYQFNSKFTPLSAAALTQVSENEGIRISNIYNYVMHNLDKAITLDDIAHKANLTPPAFCRYFKKHTGSTFITFLNQLRVNEACKKLTSGKDEAVAMIAYGCGFNSITNFNRIFKDVTGVSPREYLNHYKGNY